MNPGFGQPGQIDIRGDNGFVDVLLHGQRRGPASTPNAFETEFGWVLASSPGCFLCREGRERGKKQPGNFCMGNSAHALNC